MRPWPVLRKTAKWAGVLVCIVITGAWIASYMRGFKWNASWTAGAEDRDLFVRIRDGAIDAAEFAEPRVASEIDMLTAVPMHWRFVGDRLGTVWMPDVFVEEHLAASGRYKRTLILLPVWIPFLLCAVPTAILSRRDYILTSRARAGRCPKCGYDRRGLAADAKCPECGTVPAPAS
jgi:hypothetical protein